MIICVYLNILTREALFSLILVLTLHVVLMAMVKCHKLRKYLHQTFIKDESHGLVSSGRVCTKEKPHHPWLLNVSSHSPTR